MHSPPGKADPKRVHSPSSPKANRQDMSHRLARCLRLFLFSAISVVIGREGAGHTLIFFLLVPILVGLPRE